MDDKLKKLILLMEIKNEEKFSSFTESIKQLDKQGFELMSDIKLLFDEISKVESSVDDTELKIQIESLKESIADIQLQKGDKGDKGEDGKNGLNGKDGKDGRDGIDGIDGLNGKDGEKGENGSPDTAEDIVKKINTLESVIERKTIKGLDNLVDQPGLDRALGILDQRTQYLINKTVVQPNLAGYVPTTRTLTINGVTEDLSADRTWSVGTVTDVAALTLGTTGTDLSSTVATGTTTPVITLNVPTASALNRGALSSTDWSTFNSKESALTFSTGLTRTSNTITANLSIGVSGGQSVIGGNASGNNLTLSSTSNATKGNILFGTSAYDEVNNRLGIGTTTPGNLLSIVGNSSTPGGVAFNVKNSNVSGDTRFSLSSSNNRTLNVQVTGDSYVVNQKGAYLFTDGGLSNMTFMTDGDVGSGGSGYISFATGGYTLTTQERMRILANGNVGIGTNAPSAKLEVRGISDFWGLQVGNGTVGALFQVYGGKAGFVGFNGSAYNSLDIRSGISTQLFLATNGNAGIGTTSPSSPLHVSSSTNSITGRFTTSGISNRVIIEGTGAGFAAVSFAEAGVATRWGIGSVLSTQAFVISKSGDLAGAGNLVVEIGQSTRNMGIQLSGATAKIHIAAGSATAGTAPLKLTSGTNLTTPEAGAVEYDGSSLFFTRSGTLRAGLLMTDTASPFNTYSQSAKGATAFTSGTDNFLGGQLAGGALTGGSQNVMIGTQAGNFSNSGLLNSVMIGYFAGQSASGLATGAVFIGSQAGQNSAGATNSIFIGQLSGFNSIATNATFIGNNAGNGATNALDTIGLGQNAARNATGSIESIYLGTNTGYNATGSGITGDYNIAIGSTSARALTTGSKNVLIGYNLETQSNTADGQLTIQNAIFGTGNTGTGTTASTGKIGIYTVAPTCALDVTGGIATSRTAVTAPASTDGNIFSGTYTPTLTGVNNVTSSTAYACQYMRVGNVVTVSGKIEVTPTVNNAQTTIGVSLPIASNFANSQQCGGTAHTVANTVLGHGASIYGDATNDRAEMDYFETHGASDIFSFQFTYQII